MNETLREKEESSRIDADNIRKLRDELATLRRKVDQHAELMSEKDRTVQVSTKKDKRDMSSVSEITLPGLTRRDQHIAARARSDRRTQSNSYEGQCKAPTTVVGCEAG